MAILEDLIEPLSMEEFSRKFLFNEPFAAPGKAMPFYKLTSWPLLLEIFASGHDDCWLAKQGHLPQDERLKTGRLTFEQARKGYEEGYTVLVRHAENAHPRLAAIAKDFHDFFQDPIDIQLYCTPPEEEGFNWHYDVEEVFVIQSSGEKEFRLRRNTINPHPLYSRIPKNMQFEKEPPAPEIRCHLKAGDWLYIPSGYWHKAKALTPSFHMSVGVMALTGVDYVSALPPELVESRRWQRRLPFRGRSKSYPAESQRAALREALADLSQDFPSLLQDEARLMNVVNSAVPAK